VVSAPTLEGTEVVTSGPLGSGLEASADEEETGLTPSEVSDGALLEAPGIPDGPVLETTVVEASGVLEGAGVL
jgi:hypothetical protein